MDLETRTAWPLELRQSGRSLIGRFLYNATATVSDRGRVRKERFAPRAFDFAVNDESREVHLLHGHSFDRPLASRRAGTLELEDSAEALVFRATLPEIEAQPTYMVDAVKQIEAGLLSGVSPGFRVPPAAAVPGAEELVPEPGNPGVQVRVIRAAVLFELSLVSRPSYPDSTEVDVRAWRPPAAETSPAARPRRRVWL